MDQTVNESRRMAARRGRRRSGKHPNKNVQSVPISGTCNVCSAPCSSCMHNESTSVMESNTDGASSEESSFANSVVRHPCKGKLPNDEQHTVSEASNLQSTTSSHDSYSENAESKTNVKMAAIKPEDSNMPLSQSFLAEDDGGEVVGKMVDQHLDQFPSHSESEIAQKQMSGSLAVVLHVDNVDEKSACNDAVDLVNHVVDSKAISSPIAHSTFKKFDEDVGKDTGNTSVELFSSNSKEQAENEGSLPKDPETCADNGNTESDILEDDVKVCDICGDVGREELLAICTRCSDGAEHTYCMRIMLDKLPEGDWLCEECKLKDEAEDKTINNAEEPRDSSNLPIPDQDSKLPVVLPPCKGSQQSHATGKRSSANIVTSQETNTRAKEVIGLDVPSPRTLDNSKPSLARAVSFKNTASKMKSGNNTSRSQTDPPASIAVHALPPNSLRGHTRHSSPRGILLGSSMNNPKQKLKTIMETTKPKAKVASESITDTTKERGQTIAQSPSFRSQSMVSTNTDTSGKMHCNNRGDTQNLPLGKQKITLDKKSFSLDKSQSNSSAVTTNSTPKVEQRGARNAGRGEKTLAIRGMEDGHGSAGTNESRKQLPYTPKATGVLPCGGQTNSKDPTAGPSAPREDANLSSVSSDKACTIAVQQGKSQSELCGGQDDRNKEINHPRLPPISSGRSLRCLKCNEMGHLTQFCSVDKSRLSALKPSNERAVRDGNKGTKWRTAVEAAMCKTRMLRNNGLPGQPSDFLPNNGPSRESFFRNINRNLPTHDTNVAAVEGTKEASTSEGNKTVSTAESAKPAFPVEGAKPVSALEASKAAAAVASNNHVVSQVDNSPASREGGLTNPGESQLRPVAQNILPGKTFLSPSSFSAIPELEYVWQGCFEVRRNERFSTKFTGIQAHLSTSASAKVVDATAKLPSIMQFEEVSCLSVWPEQFHRKGSSEDDIALFFFATDAESYAKSYNRLLENMLMNDLALKGHRDGVELLIFPSNKLPQSFQRWNRLFFLWGVFRANKCDNSVHLDGMQKKACGEDSMFQNSSHDPQPLTTDASDKFVENASEQVQPEIPFGDNANKSESGGYKKLASDPNTSQQSVLFPGKQLGGVNATITERIDLVVSSPEIIETSAKLSCGERTDSCVEQNEVHVLREVGDSAKEVPSVMSKGVDIQSISCEDRLSPPNTIVIAEHSTKLPYSDWVPDLRSLVSRGNAADGSICKRGIEINQKPETISSSHDNKEHHFSRESSSFDMRSKLKRSCSHSPEPVAQPSISTYGTAPWGVQDHLSKDLAKEYKRPKLHEDVYHSGGKDENVDHRFSSKVYPVQPGFLDETREGSASANEVFPECSTSSEMVLFPVGSSSSREVPPSSFISFPFAASAGVDAVEEESPNLDLALGGKRKEKVGSLPFFLTRSGGGSNEVKPPDLALGAEEDVPTSLSLSLAIPFPEERHVPNRSGMPLQEKKSDTPFLSFGRFTDS